MTERIPQSTSKVVLFKAYLSSDHVSEATSKTIAITISKNGGAFGNPNAGATNATEVSSGWYKVTLDTTDTGTTGPLAVRGAVSSIDDVGILLEVVKATNGGYTALPDTAVTTNASLITSGTSTAQLSVSSGLVTLAGVTHTGAVIPTVTTVTNQLTAAQIATGVWTDTTAGDFTTALSVGKSLMNGVSLGTGLTINDITTKTGYSLSGSQTFNLTGNITGNLSGSVGSVTGAVGSVTGAVGSVTGAVASVTGNVGGNVTGSVGSVVGAVGSVTGLTAANLDVAVSTRLATAGYTAPDNTTITAIAGYVDTEVAAIKAKTDQLTFSVANKIDANIKSVADTTVTGAGTTLDPWGP